MGAIFNQINKEDRHLISILKSRKVTNIEIAKEIGCSVRTIGRELKRGRMEGRSYNSIDANRAKSLRKITQIYVGFKIEEHEDLRLFIIEALKSGQRPEAIAGRIKHYHLTIPSITARSIYNWIYSSRGQQYSIYLPSNRSKPKKRKKEYSKQERIPDRTPITNRPISINNRSRHGHTSSDTMVSGTKTRSRVAIAGTIERKTRYLTLSLIPNLKPSSMNIGLKKNFKKQMIKIYSDTKDNGIENMLHRQIEDELGIKSYFCQPYHSWEKGEIENAFKLVRAEGVPKGCDLSMITPQRLAQIEDTINSRWRKSLNYASPKELMAKRLAYEQKLKRL